MLPDPSRSWAVLVGVSEFDDAGLDGLPTVAAGVGHLRDLLVDPSVWGLPPERCTVVLNPRSGDEVLDPVADGCAAADDAFLLYYAGHGILDPRPFELYLATVATKLAPIRRSVRFDDVRRVLEPRPKLSKVVILDCCYSGLAIAGTMSDGVKVSDQLLVNRSYIMTATSSTRLALAPPDEPYPAFTGELIRVLGDGIAGGPDDLTMASIYGQVLSGLAAKRRPTPQASADNDGHTIVLARNRALRPPPDDAVPDAVESAQPVPEEHGHLLGLTPARTVEYLAEHGDRDALLEAIGRRREPQGLAAVVHALRRAGSDGPARTVVAAAAGRPVGDILAIVDSLGVLGLGGLAEDLLRAAGGSGDALVCALSPHLSEPQREVLVEAALRRRAAGPAAMIRLIGMLWATESRGAVERVLRTIGATMPHEDVVVFADALSDGGYDEAAFELYALAEDVLAARAAPAAVRVAASMNRAGRHEWAQRLLARVADRCDGAAVASEVVTALWAAGLTEAAGDLLETCAARLDDADVTGLAERLRAHGRGDEALDLLKQAASRRPVTSAWRYFRFLFDLGLPMDAHSLLRHVGTVLDGASLADAAVYAHEAGPETSYPADLLRAAAAREPACGRDLLVRLGSRPDPAAPPLVERAEREIAEAGAEHGFAVAALLIHDGRSAGARSLVSEVAARFEDPDVVSAFLRRVDDLVGNAPPPAAPVFDTLPHTAVESWFPAGASRPSRPARETPRPARGPLRPAAWVPGSTGPRAPRAAETVETAEEPAPPTLRIPVPPGPPDASAREVGRPDLAVHLRGRPRDAAALLALLVPVVPVACAGAVLGALLRLVPAAAAPLVERLLGDAALRAAVGRADLWHRFPAYAGALLADRATPFEERLARALEPRDRALFGAFADEVAVNGSVTEILGLVSRTGIDGFVLDALGWGASEAQAIVDRWDPRRFHVADRLLRAGREPRPAVPLPLRRPTPAAIAVSRLLLEWSQTDYRPWVDGWTRAFGADLGLDPDDEILFMASVDGPKVILLTTTGLRFGPLARRRQTVLTYAEVAGARFEEFNGFTVRVLRRDAPVGFVTLVRDDAGPGLLSGLLRSAPRGVPGMWFTAAELADRLTELGSLVRDVLALDPGAAPARRDVPERPPPADHRPGRRPRPRAGPPLPPLPS